VNEYWNNLRPLEKRLVVAVGSALFVVLNFWFVVPHFSDWSKTGARNDKAHKTLTVFLAEIAKAPEYKRAITRLQGEGLVVAQEEQATHFSTSIQSEAARSGFIPTSTGKIRTDTNQFFLELSQNITVVSKEQQLVDFLYNLGSGTSLIRVRDLGLHTDPPRQQLMANVKLVGSFQRNLPAKTAGVSTPPAQKPAASSPPKKGAEPAKPAPATNRPAGPSFKPATNSLQRPALPNKKKS
jgi:hypothetical protein